MRFVEYTEEYKEKWDKFVMNDSVNGTFLHTRKFLSYHGEDKFIDTSVLVFDAKNNIIAVCPACILNEDGISVFYSHKGSTFGGLIIRKKEYQTLKVIELINEFEKWIKGKGIKKIVYSITADPFSIENDDLFDYCFTYLGYKEYKELNFGVDLTKCKNGIYSNLSHGKKENVRLCKKNNIVFREIDSDMDMQNFYDILCLTLRKYGIKPVHSLEELKDFTRKRLINECKLYGTFLGEKMVAGACLFVFERTKCIHTQYLCASLDYNKLSPMTFTYYSVLEEAERLGYNIVTWGIATEEKGKIINEGLVNSKEAYGGFHFINKTFFKMI